MSFYLYTLSMNSYGVATTVAEFDTETAAESAKDAIKRKFTPNDNDSVVFRAVIVPRTDVVEAAPPSDPTAVPGDPAQ